MIMPMETEIDVAIKQLLNGIGTANQHDIKAGFKAICEYSLTGKPFPPGPYGLDQKAWEDCLKTMCAGVGLIASPFAFEVKACSPEEAKKLIKEWTNQDIDLEDLGFSEEK